MPVGEVRVSALRCLGWTAPCARPVDPVVGGAWCTEHRPVDLTGEQWDTAKLIDVRDSNYRTRIWNPRYQGRCV